MSQRVKMDLESMKLLENGLLAKVFANELRHVVDDCRGRPNDKTARSVSVKFSVTPKVDPNGPGGDLDEVELAVDIQSSVPKRKSAKYTMQVHQNNEISFHPDLPDDPEGSTLYDEDVRNREREGGK